GTPPAGQDEYDRKAEQRSDHNSHQDKGFPQSGAGAFGVAVEGADDFDDPPDVADLPVLLRAVVIVVVTPQAGLAHSPRDAVAQHWPALVLLKSVDRFVRILAQAAQGLALEFVRGAAVGPELPRVVAVEAHPHAGFAPFADSLAEIDRERCR